MPVTDEPHSARRNERGAEGRGGGAGGSRRRGDGRGESSGVEGSRGHVNGYMLATRDGFIHAAAARAGEVWDGRGQLTRPEC